MVGPRFPGSKNVPVSALPQLVQDSIHAGVAVIVVICTTILAFQSKVPADVTGAVFTGVVGYVAGRAGSVPRGMATRKDDPTEPDLQEG